VDYSLQFSGKYGWAKSLATFTRFAGHGMPKGLIMAQKASIAKEIFNILTEKPTDFVLNNFRLATA
jgi:hypothetical protein